MDIIQKYRPYGIAVTDLSSQLWCEKQLEFSLEKGRIKTLEMQKGGDRHQDLLEEITEVIKVQPKSLEDLVALKLNNSIAGLAQVLSEGRGREIPIFGNVNSLFVVGTIDELSMDKRILKLIDTKTRISERMPSMQQLRMTKFQMMLYMHLFDSIKKGEFRPNDLLNCYELGKNSVITEEFNKQLEKLGLKIEPKVSKSADSLFSMIKKFPEIGELEIVYEHQDSRRTIGRENFQFDINEFKRNCDFVEEFWTGKRAAIPVGEKNRWKCNYCEFRSECPTLIAQSKRLANFV